MRHNLVDNCARRALAIFASAALVAGLVPVAAFGEVGGGPSVADASSDARLVEQGAQTGAGSANVPSEGGDTSGAGSVSGPGVHNSSASGSESDAPSELSAPSGSDTFGGGNNAGSPSSPDVGNLSGSSPDSTPGGSSSAPDTGDAPSAPEPSAPETFTDVEPGSWYEPGVLFCQQKKIMTGIAGTTLFGVGQSLSRAQMAVMMWRYADPEAASAYLGDADNETGMDDVESRTWYTAAANWAVENKVINGFPQDDGSFAFKPDVSVTLDQFCTIIANFNHVDPRYGTASLSRFSDSEGVPQWAACGLAWCVDKGLVSGYDRGGGIFELCPTVELPRERAATVFMRGYDVGVFDDGSAPLVSPCEDLGLSRYWFIRSASVSSLSIEARSEGDVRLASANLSLSQTFTFSYENGYYHIIYVETGLALETAPGIASSPSDVSFGAAVSQSKRQQWSAVRTESGALRFCNLATGYWLASQDPSMGSPLQAVESPEEDVSSFVLVEQQDLLSEGLFTISPKGDFSKHLDVVDASVDDGANVQIWYDNGLLAQKWYVKRASGKVNTYTLQAACSGKHLATDSNGNAVQRTADGSSEQLWRADFSGGFVVFTNVGTGRALDLADGCTDAGTNVQTYAANGTDAQRFSLRETQPLPEGLYTICLAGTDQVIDLRDESQKSNANIQTWISNGTGAQIWNIEHNQDGSYTFTNCGSKMAIDIFDGIMAVGTNVQQHEVNGSQAQKWRAIYNGDGTFSLVPFASGSVALGTTGTSGGSNVELVSRGAAARLTFQMATLPAKVGYQNPAGYYQVSSRSVTLPDYASGYFTYVTPSQIAPDATREDCIDAFINRAYDYIGTAYRWNYSMEPGVGVDCIGLVYQCLYATGMDLGEFNPYDHYATGADGWHSHDANNMWDYGDVLHLPLSMRQRGDVISWEGHVAIYLGNDMIIDAYGPVDVHSMWSRGVPRGVLRFYQ